MPILNCPKGTNRYVSDKKLCTYLTEQSEWTRQATLWMVDANKWIKKAQKVLASCCNEYSPMAIGNDPPEDPPKFPPP